jgi:hypothetical protein
MREPGEGPAFQLPGPGWTKPRRLDPVRVTENWVSEDHARVVPITVNDAFRELDGTCAGIVPRVMLSEGFRTTRF